MENEDKNILALGLGGRWIIYRPHWITISVAGFLFWSAVIAAARQVVSLVL